MLSCLLSTVSFAQTTLKGKVLEDKSQAPIPYATVYIDGTSNGTITDENGTFELTDVRPPAKLVVSHLSYLPQVKEVFVQGDSHINFSLEKRRQEIDQVKVEAENARAENVADFNRLFLGDDYWGKEGIILNDSVLYFKRNYKDVIVEREDTTFTRRICTKFEAQACEPLLIDLPVLGYTIHVDLVSCYQDVKTFYTNSYIYYISYQDLSRHKRRKMEKNRQKVYYNSIQHFCRALYSNTLEEEGYGVYRKSIHPLTREISYPKKDLTENLVFESGDQMLLMGLKDSSYRISYFYNSKGAPDKVNEDCFALPNARSVIIVDSDTCALSKNGLLPGTHISFGGTLGRKRIGGMLPKYYQLPTK